MNRSSHTHLIWDWNGTLLNDTELCVDVLNRILSRRGYDAISVEDYRKNFRFPVVEFYNFLGFDFERDSFAKVSAEFIDDYERHWFSECQLHGDTAKLLDAIAKQGRTQSVLSASKQEALELGIHQYQIRHYFNDLAGTSNIFADGKIARGEVWIEASSIARDDILLIGDTVHDKEVADAMGVDCLLIAHGHYSYERLSASGAPVVSDFGELQRKLFGSIVS